MRLLLVTLALAAGCDREGADPSGPCSDLCTTLIDDCRYAAFPTFGSCEQGCTFTASEGADVHEQATCVADAGCDTFAILECQHAYGN